MIRRLRARHRFMLVALTIVLPVAVAGGIAARDDEPLLDDLPDGLAAAESELPQDISLSDDLWPGLGIRVGLRSTPVQTLLVLQPTRDLKLPDVLVYWAPGEEEGAERLPENAVLLGTLAGVRARTLPLPPRALASLAPKAGQPSRLILYSLGHQELLASAPLEAGR